MKTALFLAKRFIFHTRERTIKTMMVICFMSIMIGAFALALVAAIMNGFEKETQKAVQGIQPDIIITAHDRALSYQKVKSVLETYPFVSAMSPSAQGHALIKAPDSDELSSLVMLMAVDPTTQSQISRLNTMVKMPPQADLKTLLADNRILIGQTLAHHLAVKINDPLTLLFTHDTDAQNIMLEQKKVTVGGMFKTGIEEIDAHLVFCDFPLFKSMYPDKGVTQIGVKIVPGTEANALETLKKRFTTLNVFSWKELYPALLSALILEKYAMFFILALITLVASMNIVALLFMFITSKKTEIAVLKTLGLSSKELALVFIIIGVGISCIAGILGLLLALGASFILEHYPLIRLPEVYYVSHLPAHMDGGIVIAVLLLIITISFIASYFPARKVYTLDAAPVLKQTT